MHRCGRLIGIAFACACVFASSASARPLDACPSGAFPSSYCYWTLPGLSGSYNAAAKTVTVTWTWPDANIYILQETHIGTLSNGLVSINWQGDITPFVSNQDHSRTSFTWTIGASNTDGVFDPKQKLYVQLWFWCGEFLANPKAWIPSEGSNTQPYCGGPYDSDGRAWFYTNAVPVSGTGTGGSSSGGGKTGGTSSGSGGGSTASSGFSFSAAVKVHHASGGVESVKGPAQIKPFDEFDSGGAAVHLTTPNGPLVMDKKTSIEYETSGSAAAAYVSPSATGWKLTAGQVWMTWKAAASAWIDGKTLGVWTNVSYSTNDAFTMTIGAAGDTVRCYAGRCPGVFSIATGVGKSIQLRAGEEATAAPGGPLVVKKLVPIPFFWKTS